MKYIIILLSLFITQATIAENIAEHSPMTMEQLMRELRVQGGNWNFTFDQPVTAQVVTTVSDYPEGKEETRQVFASDTAQKEIELYFIVSNIMVGDYSRGDHMMNSKKMSIKLSDCEKTSGIRFVHYYDKYIENRFSHLAGELNDWKPSIPENPELNKEYILHWYFMKGEAYHAKATITFLPKDKS